MTARYMTRARHRQAMELLARTEFADHVLTEEAPSRWRCGKPNTGIFSFRVMVAPHVVVLYGDIGELILRTNDAASIGWLRGAVRSSDYLLGKDPLGSKRKTFLPGEARRVLAEYIRAVEDRDDRRQRLRTVESIIDDWTLYGESDGDGFCRAWFEAVDDTEVIDSVYDRDSESWLCAFALRRFVELLDAGRSA